MIDYRENKQFRKHLMRLPLPIQLRVRDTIAEFKINPTAHKLRNHKLSGQFKDTWSISAGGDIRIHYKKYADNVVVIIFVDVGTHAQLY